MLKGFRIVNCRLLHSQRGATGKRVALNGLTVTAGDRSCCGVLVLMSCLWVSLAGLPVHSQTAAPNGPATTPAATPPSPTQRPTLKLGSQGSSVSELQALLKLLGFYPEAIDGLYQDSTARAVSAFQQAAGIQPDGIAGAETWARLLPPVPATPPTAATPTLRPVSPPGLPTIPAANQPAASPVPTLTPTPTPAPTTVNPAPHSPTPGYTPVAPAPTPSPTPSPTVSSVEFPILRVGMQGDAVVRLQERLKTIGVFSGAIDGSFGPETEAAVQAAQRNFNLEPDGIVGPATWEALLRGN